MKKQDQTNIKHDHVPEGFVPVEGVEGLYIDSKEVEPTSPKELEVFMREVVANFSPLARSFVEATLNTSRSNGDNGKYAQE